MRLSWFKQMRVVNVWVSVPMIQEVAGWYAEEFKVADFHASSGWEKKFKVWIGSPKKSYLENLTRFQYKLWKFVQKVSWIFSIVQQWKHFKCWWVWTFLKQCLRRAWSWGVTLVRVKNFQKNDLQFCFVLVQQERLTPLVIGKSSKPRAFKNLKAEDLPITWRSNWCAWMTADLFEKWISVDKYNLKNPTSWPRDHQNI